MTTLERLQRRLVAIASGAIDLGRVIDLRGENADGARELGSRIETSSRLVELTDEHGHGVELQSARRSHSYEERARSRHGRGTLRRRAAPTRPICRPCSRCLA